MGDREVDLSAGTILTPEGLLPLTRNEVGLLDVLYDNLGEVVHRDLLMQEGLGYRTGLASRAVDQAIWRLRRKLEPDPHDPVFLRSETNEGYALFLLPAPVPVATVGEAPFVGRAREQALLLAAVRESRIVTVCGPAGVGKTRLVMEVASAFPAPAVVARLGHARDRADVQTAVAVALGVAGQGEVSLLVPAGLWSRGPLVLVLDGADAVLANVIALLPAWLDPGSTHAAGLHLVVTSRAPLGISGEQRVPLGPLETEAAVDLFLDRAARTDPTFHAPRERVAALVHALDGLPLAVALAATRAPLLSLETLLAASLAAPLAVLPTGLADVMASALAQLVPEERALVESWSVFEAPFRLEDLVAVDGGAPATALERLTRLADQGLVTIHRGPQGLRYALLGVFRDLARQRVGQTDPGGSRARHAAYFATLGVRAFLEAVSGDVAGRARLRDASADLLAVVRSNQPDGLRAACGLALLWRLSREGPAKKGLDVLDLLRGAVCEPGLQARLAEVEARLCAQIGASDRGLAVVADALALSLDPDDEAQLRCVHAMLLRLAGRTGIEHELVRARAVVRGDRARAYVLQTSALYAETYEDAEPQLIEATRLLAGLSDPLAEGIAWSLYGHIAECQGAWRTSVRALQRALDVLDDDPLALRQRALTALAAVGLARVQGRFDAANALLDEVESSLSRFGTPDTQARARVERARLLPYEEAVLALSSEVAHATGNDRVLAEALIGLADFHVRHGDFAAARSAIEEGLSPACKGLAALQKGVLHAMHAAVLLQASDLSGAAHALEAARATDPQGAARVLVRTVEVLEALALGATGRARGLCAEVGRLHSALGITDGAALAWWRRSAEQQLTQDEAYPSA